MEFIQEFSKNRDASSLQEALRIKELETVIKVCDEFKGLGSDIAPFIYFKKAKALLALQREEEGLRVLAIAQEIFEENYGTQEQAYNWTKEISDLYLQIILEQAKYNTQNPNKSLWLYNEAYQLTKEPEQRYEFKKLRYEAYQDLVNSREPLKRFAYIDEELPSSEPQFITPLLCNNTGNIQFVGASPHKGSFWISHPFRNRVYYYFENALQLAFNDYINEFVQLLQHLGATQVILEYINPNQNAEDPAAEKLPDDVTLPDRGRKMNVTTLEYNFQPKQKAHLPTHLAWYASQPQWQSIVAERSQGSVTEFNIVLNSAGILNSTPQDLEEVQEEYRDLLENYSKNIKADALKQKRRQRKIFKQENTAVSLKRNWIAMECNIKVKFAPLSELTEEVNLQKIQTFDVELPEISLENRKMTSVDVTTIISEVIEKIEVEDKSKIKRENTREIPLQVEETAYDKWKKLTQESTPKEVEIKDKIEQIQPKRERGTLDEFLTETPTTPKETTNSTKQEEKQKQEKETKEELIDSMGLTQDERFYYEMLQHAYQDGTISEDVRKVLERRRQRFKISEERAKEIEQMMLDKKYRC